MVIEKYFGIDPKLAKQMMEATNGMTNEKSGDNGFQNTKVFLFDEYAVLKTQNMDFRNVTNHDPDLKHLERLSRTLLDLRAQGVNVVPILAFWSGDGDGYIIQPRAKGTELYDRDKLHSGDKGYVLERVGFLSDVPQGHFDKFVADTTKIHDADIIIDFVGKDNFFYDEKVGFQFVDLNAHFDYEYEPNAVKPQGRGKHSGIAFLSCFMPLSHCPCYFATMPKYGDIVSKLLSELGDGERMELKENNRRIFEKCKTAALNNGIAEELINETVAGHKFILQMQHLDLL